MMAIWSSAYIPAGLVATSNGILAYHMISSQGDNPAPPGIFGNSDGTLLMQVFIFLTTLSGFIFTWLRESRNRKWDQEDRERARAELSETTKKTAEALANKVEETNVAIQNKIEENTELTRQAASNSGTVEARIAEITRMFTEQKIDQLDERVAKLERTRS